jgi:hypothetical protein
MRSFLRIKSVKLLVNVIFIVVVLKIGLMMSKSLTIDGTDQLQGNWRQDITSFMHKNNCLNILNTISDLLFQIHSGDDIMDNFFVIAVGWSLKLSMVFLFVSAIKTEKIMKIGII